MLIDYDTFMAETPATQPTRRPLVDFDEFMAETPTPELSAHQRAQAAAAAQPLADLIHSGATALGDWARTRESQRLNRLAPREQGPAVQPPPAVPTARATALEQAADPPPAPGPLGPEMPITEPQRRQFDAAAADMERMLAEGAKPEFGVLDGWRDMARRLYTETKEPRYLHLAQRLSAWSANAHPDEPYGGVEVEGPNAPHLRQRLAIEEQFGDTPEARTYREALAKEKRWQKQRRPSSAGYELVDAADLELAMGSRPPAQADLEMGRRSASERPGGDFTPSPGMAKYPNLEELFAAQDAFWSDPANAGQPLPWQMTWALRGDEPGKVLVQRESLRKLREAFLSDPRKQIPQGLSSEQQQALARRPELRAAPVSLFGTNPAERHEAARRNVQRLAVRDPDLSLPVGLGATLVRGTEKVAGGALQFGGIVLQNLQPPNFSEQGNRRGKFDRAGEALLQQGERLQELAANLYKSPSAREQFNPTSLAWWTENVGEQLPQLAAIYASGGLGRVVGSVFPALEGLGAQLASATGAALAAAGDGGQTAANIRKTLLAQGKSQDEANLTALMLGSAVAMTSAALEKANVDSWMKPVVGRTVLERVAKRMARGIASEAPVETLQGWTQEAAEFAATGKTPDWIQGVVEGILAAPIGALGGAGGAAMTQDGVSPSQPAADANRPHSQAPPLSAGDALALNPDRQGAALRAAAQRVPIDASVPPAATLTPEQRGTVVSTPATAQPTPPGAAADYAAMAVGDLRQLARERGITGPLVAKTKIIEKLKAADAAQTVQASQSTAAALPRRPQEETSASTVTSAGHSPLPAANDGQPSLVQQPATQADPPAAPADQPALKLPLEQVQAETQYRALADYTDRLYRETSPAALARILKRGADDPAQALYFANGRDLAMGQGENRGVLLEVDPAGLIGEVSKKKPGWEFQYAQGQAELIAPATKPQRLRPNLRAITFQADIDPGPARLWLAKLEREGWSKQANPDGSITYARPGKPETMATESGGATPGGPAEEPAAAVKADLPPTPPAASPALDYQAMAVADLRQLARDRGIAGPLVSKPRIIEALRAQDTAAVANPPAPSLVEQWNQLEAFPDEGSWDSDVRQRYGGSFIAPLEKALKAGQWKTPAQYVVGAYRNIDSPHGRVARDLAKMAEAGLVQQAWDRQGQTHYAANGVPLPSWLTKDDTPPAGSAPQGQAAAPDYAAMSVTDLRKLARDRGITGPLIAKTKIVERLLAADAAQQKGPQASTDGATQVRLPPPGGTSGPGNVPGGSLPQDAASGKRRKPARTSFSKAAIERRLLDYHEEMGQGWTAHDDALLEETGAGGNPFVFLHKLPGEIRDYLENNPAALRLFRVTGDPAKSGGEDAMAHLGDRYFEMIDRLTRSRIGQALKTAKGGGDPAMTFWAQVYENLPPAKERRQQIGIDPATLATGQSFEINGDRFRVVEEDEGYRVLKDGQAYDEVPIEALTGQKIPVDKGTLKEAEPADASRPIFEGIAEEPVQSAARPQTGIFGQPEYTRNTGDQQPLFHEPVQAQRPQGERVGSTSANDPRHTPSMFEGEAGLRGRIRGYLQEHPNADLHQIGKALGVEPGPAENPMSSPLNKALVAMRDAGEIEVRTSTMGSNVSFTLKQAPPRSGIFGENAPASGSAGSPLRVLEAPAPQGVHRPGRIPVAPLSGGEPKQLREIIFDAAKALNRRVKTAKTGPGVGGTYYPGSTRTIIRFAGDLDTTAHELAHALDDAYGLTSDWAKSSTQFDFELIPHFSRFGSVTQTGPRSAIEYQRWEGAAEWLRAFIVNPDAARAAAPQFHAHYLKTVPFQARTAIQRFSREIRQWAGLPATERTAANIRMQVQDLPMGQRLKQALAGDGYHFPVTLLDRIKVRLLDDLWPLRKAMLEAKAMTGRTDLTPENDPETLLRLWNGGNGKLLDWFENGPVDASNRRVDAPNLAELLEPFDASSRQSLERDMRDAAAYMVNQRVIERATQIQKQADALKAKLDPADPATPRRRNFIQKAAEARMGRLAGTGGGIYSDFEQAKAALAEIARNPERQKMLQEAADRLRRFADATLRYLLDKGRISQEQYQAIQKNNQYYVPMQRLADGEELGWLESGGKRLASVKQPIKKFAGSTRQIENPYVSLLANTAKAIREADRNEILAKFTQLLSIKRTMHQGEPIPVDLIGSQAKIGDDSAVRVFRDGKVEYWQFDPAIRQALDNWSSVNDTTGPVKVLGFLASVLRGGVVKSPPFVARQMFKDAINRYVISRTGSKPWDVLRPVSDEELSAFRLAGGDQAGLYLKDSLEWHKYLNTAMRDAVNDGKTILLSPLEIGRNTWRWWSTQTEKWGDQRSRLAEYRSAFARGKEKGLDDYNASLYAAREARELLDYATAGTWIRWMRRYLPSTSLFVNPAIQAPYRAWQGFKANPRAFALRWSLGVLMPTLALRALRSKEDEEEARQFPAYRRDMFWNIKIAPDLWLSIPRPYELGVFAAAVERMLDHAQGDPRAFEGFGGSLARSLLPVDETLIAGELTPLVEAMANYGLWRGEPIVPRFEEQRDVSLRKGTDRASRVGRLVQRVVGVDARKIDHVIEGLTGQLGKMVLDLSSLGEGQPGTEFLRRQSGVLARTPAGDARDVQAALDEAQRLGDSQSPEARALVDRLRQIRELTHGPQREEAARTLREEAGKLRDFYQKHQKTLLRYRALPDSPFKRAYSKTVNDLRKSGDAEGAAEMMAGAVAELEGANEEQD